LKKVVKKKGEPNAPNATEVETASTNGTKKPANAKPKAKPEAPAKQ
jgi:hypothetical protein